MLLSEFDIREISGKELKIIISRKKKSETLYGTSKLSICFYQRNCSVDGPRTVHLIKKSMEFIHKMKGILPVPITFHCNLVSYTYNLI